MSEHVTSDSKKAASANKTPQSALLTRRQVADRLGVCSHTIQRLTRRGELPALVFNRRLIRYKPEVIESFIAQARI